MTGLFAHLLGYAFGFPPLYNIDTGEPRIGKMGLMDVGFYNGRGVVPAPASAWIRSNEHFNFNYTEVINITDDIFDLSNNAGINVTLSYRGFVDDQSETKDQIYKIDIAADEGCTSSVSPRHMSTT